MTKLRNALIIATALGAAGCAGEPPEIDAAPELTSTDGFTVEFNIDRQTLATPAGSVSQQTGHIRCTGECDAFGAGAVLATIGAGPS